MDHVFHRPELGLSSCPLAALSLVIAVCLFGTGCASGPAPSKTPPEAHVSETLTSETETDDAAPAKAEVREMPPLEHQAADIAGWSLTKRCRLFDLLARQYLHMMGWSTLSKYTHNGKVRMYVLLEPEKLLIGLEESCPVAELDVAIFPEKGRWKPLEVYASGPPHEHPEPYLSLALREPSDDAAPLPGYTFSWKLNRVSHNLPVWLPSTDEDGKNLPQIRAGDVVIPTPAPTVEIVVVPSADTDGLDVRRAVIRFMTFGG